MIVLDDEIFCFVLFVWHSTESGCILFAIAGVLYYVVFLFAVKYTIL